MDKAAAICGCVYPRSIRIALSRLPKSLIEKSSMNILCVYLIMCIMLNMFI